MRRRLVCCPLDTCPKGRRHGVGGVSKAHRLREEPPNSGFEPLLRPGLLRGPPDVRGDCDDVETRDVLLKKAAHDARCAHRGPGAQPRVADESIGGLFSRLRGA